MLVLVVRQSDQRHVEGAVPVNSFVACHPVSESVQGELFVQLDVTRLSELPLDVRVDFVVVLQCLDLLSGVVNDWEVLEFSP